jgi:putative ABC transport system ATP-binding protein
VRVVLRARALTKVYPTPAGDVEAVVGFDHRFLPGAVTAVVGPSGSGKSTLLNLLAGFDPPTAGEVWIGDDSVFALPERERSRLRLHRFGFVFQTVNLVAVLTAEQNVALPMGLAGVPVRERRDRTRALLERFGLSKRADHLPHRLSGGERQRVALARALANDPDVVFADEPTGALDSASGRVVLEALRSVAQDGRTVVLVTHDVTLSDRSEERITLLDGRVVKVERRSDAAAPQDPGAQADPMAEPT